MNVETPFPIWLKQRRKALDLRQEDLAERIGCSESTIRKFELGERRPSRQVAELLAESLGYVKYPMSKLRGFYTSNRS